MVNFLINSILDFFDWGMSFFQVYAGLPPEVVSAFEFFGAKTRGYLCVLPQDTMLKILYLNLAVAFGLLMWKGSVWLVHWKQGK